MRTLLIALGLAIASAPALADTSCPVHFAASSAPVITNPKLARKLRELCFDRYAVLHSGVLRVPVWAAERLTAEGAKAALATAGGTFAFKAEKRLPKDERAELADYAKSGYDRGHLVPSGNFARAADDRATFTLANVVPQHPCLNQRSWRLMEEAVLKRAANTPETYVVTGPLYEGARIGALKGRVFVPTATYKAIYTPGRGAGVYVATNPRTNDDVPVWSVISVAALTARAGVDVFPGLDDATKATALALTLPKEPRKACTLGD